MAGWRPEAVKGSASGCRKFVIRQVKPAPAILPGMATFDVGRGEIDCPHCGSRHGYQYRELPHRDPGQQACLACGQVLLEWDSYQDYEDFWLLTQERRRAG